MCCFSPLYFKNEKHIYLFIYFLNKAHLFIFFYLLFFFFFSDAELFTSKQAKSLKPDEK